MQVLNPLVYYNIIHIHVERLTRVILTVHYTQTIRTDYIVLWKRVFVVRGFFFHKKFAYIIKHKILISVHIM